MGLSDTLHSPLCQNSFRLIWNNNFKQKANKLWPLNIQKKEKKLFDAMGLFGTLEDVFKIGSKVIINWHYEKSSDKMAGLGED